MLRAGELAQQVADIQSAAERTEQHGTRRHDIQVFGHVAGAALGRSGGICGHTLHLTGNGGGARRVKRDVFDADQ